MNKSFLKILAAFSLLFFSASLASAADPVYRFGGNVVITEDVPADLIVGGGQVVVEGDVAGDLKAFGGKVTVNGDVAGDVLTAGGEVVINGVVEKNLQSYGGDIQLNGKVLGDADISGGAIRLGPKAKIQGNLQYGSPQNPKTFRDHVMGAVTNNPKKTRKLEKLPPAGFSPLRLIHRLLTGIIVGATVLVLMPKTSANLSKNIKESPLVNTVIGLIALPVIFVVAVLCTLLFALAWPISVALILGALVALVFCTIPVKLALGEAVDRRLVGWKLSPVKAYLLGLFCYVLVTQIPKLGGLVRVIAVLLGFGTVVRLVFEQVSLKKLPNI